MSDRALDRHGRWRSLTIAFRISPEENEGLNARVRLSGLTKQDYVISRCLERDIVVISEITMEDYLIPWHFVIIDEVHRYLHDSKIYEKLRKISSYASNILLLSATPVQQRKEEYLALLRLLQPQKYDQYTPEQFGTLIEKQSRIIQKTALVLDDLNDMVDEYEHILDDGMEPHESEDITDLFEEITDELGDINKDLNDAKLSEMLNQLDFDTEDCSIYQIKVIISYICGNYQIENNIIGSVKSFL